MPAPVLRDWKKGDRFSAGHLQESVTVARMLLQVGSNKHNVVQTPTGTTMQYDTDPTNVIYKMGVVQNDSTYSDERYVVKFAYANSGLETDVTSFTAEDPAQSSDGTYMDPQTVVATNLAERATHSHNLQPNEEVQLFAIYDRQNPPVLHWFFNKGGALGTGQYQYMSYRMVSQNQAGWDFDRAHPVLIP